MIEIKGLSKKIKKNLIIDNVTLSFEKGKTYGFYGPNGSGKTMIFRAICGLIKPTEGEIYIDGKKLHKDMDFPESVGILIEGPGFIDYLTGFENLKILADIRNKISDDDISNMIRQVGLNPLDKRKYKEYSLGMKQRLGIAQAIMESPSILILDEPTNALDEEAIKMVHDLIRKEKEKGTTIFLASHNKNDIDELCDEIFYVYEGKYKKIDPELDENVKLLITEFDPSGLDGKIVKIINEGMNDENLE